MMSEFTFILLGGVLMWLGLNDRFMLHFNPRTPGWLALGAALVFWGVRAWRKTARAARASDRIVDRVGGASLVAVGFIMLGLASVEYRSVGMVLALAGAILALRGLTGAVLSLRTD